MGGHFFYDVASLGRPAGNQAHQYHNNGNNYKNMNESAYGIGRNQAQKPQNQQNNRNGIKHIDLPFSYKF